MSGLAEAYLGAFPGLKHTKPAVRRRATVLRVEREMGGCRRWEEAFGGGGERRNGRSGMMEYRAVLLGVEDD